MNPNTNTKVKGSKSKHTKRPDPLFTGDKNSGLNPSLPFVKPAKDTDVDKENLIIKTRINDNISRDNKMNYKTKNSKLIETFG